MASKEARLILNLVDGVTGPARGIVGALNSVNNTVSGMKTMALAPMRALDTMARDIRRRAGDMAALSAGLTVGITQAMSQVYDLEKQLNISQAAGGIGTADRNRLMAEAVRLNGEYAATSTEIVAGANEVLKAGMSFDQALGSLPAILDTAQAMDVPIAEASASIVNAMVAQRMAMEDTAKTMKSSTRMADLYAYALAETTASLEDFTTSGKYFNPVAAAIGMSPGETMAWQIALAKSGIQGSSAGTGLRSAPVSIAAPSKGGREAFARLGINPQEFVGKRTGDATGDTVAAALEAAGFNSDGMEASIEALLKDKQLRKSTGKLANAIIEQFGEDLGVQTGQDRTIISDAVQDALTAGVSQIDLAGVLKALHDKGAGIGDYAAIFGKNHASKMMAIDLALLEHYLDAVETATDGFAKRQRQIGMQGIVGDWNAFTAAIEATTIAVGKSGVLADAARVLQSMADSLSKIAAVNPELLRMGSYGVLALAAMAPLGLAISGVASAAALLVNPLTWVVGGLTYLAAVNWDGISGFFKNFGSILTDNINPEILTGIANGLTSVKDAFAGLDSTGYNAKWASAAATSGKAAADAINATYDAIVRITSTRYAENFAAGVVAAFRSIGDAAQWAVTNLDGMGMKLQPVIDMMNTETGGNLGYIAGQILAFGAAAAVASAGIRMIAGPIKLAGTALALLTGIKPAWEILAFIGRLGSYATAAAGITSLATAVSGLGTALTYMARVASGLPALAAFVTGKMLLGQKPRDPSYIEPGRAAEAEAYWRQFHGVPFEGGMHRAGRGAGPAPGTGTAATPQIDTAEIARQAQEAGNIVKAGLSVTGKPRVDTSDLDATIGKLTTIQRMLAGMGSVSVGGGASKSSGPAFGGPRADGGPVRRGLTYLVGERGPELFTPGASGGITPNSDLGGRVGANGDVHYHTAVSQTFNVTAGSPEEFARYVGRQLNSALSRSRQIGLDGRPTY